MSEIDDGWVLPNDGPPSRPRLATGSAPVTAPPAGRDGWPLRATDAPKGVDLNTATADELVAVPGIGARKARTIVEWRERHGPFARVDDLVDLHGFGPKLVGALAEHLRV